MTAGTGGLACTTPAALTGVPATRYPVLTVHTLPPLESIHGILLAPALWKSK